MKQEEAMKILKDFHDNSALFSVRTALETLHPEFKESEDERIRKEILEYFQQFENGKLCGVNISDWIAWLEKQGEKTKPIEGFDTEFERQISHLIASAIDREHEYNEGYVKWTANALLEYAKHELEKQCEQNPVDKVEPKFKIEKGKWYVCIKDLLDNYANKAFREGDIYLSTQNGSLIPSNSNVPYDVVCPDTYFRDWTIEDAKDGDVLYSKGLHGDCIFIFNGLDKWKFDEPNGDKAVATGYCCLFVSADNMEFGIQGPDCIEVNTIKPTTKIQRDLLFQKMQEAGYEWDAEKKELKPIDKAEPKFKVGDWIVIDNPCQIESIKSNGNYIVRYCDAEETHLLSRKFCESHFHLWTIQDAKDGDVLVWNDNPFLFSKYEKDEYGFVCCSYCGISGNNEFVVNTNDKKYWCDIEFVNPASKEQRDLLFKKMHEAGYEWDAEKKELKLLITNGGDFFESGEQNTSWSEEDEKFFKTALWHISYSISNGESTDIYCDTTEWLKSLKDKVQPQSTWKPSDEQLYFLHWLATNVLTNGEVEKKASEVLESLYNDLKKLKGE